MDLINIKKDEMVTFKLRELFELRGFMRTRVNKFEEYDLYVENRNFLDSDNIITFMDMDGRLKALKPDITLSVVRNSPSANPGHAIKLYYIDEVCRLSGESREYKMRGQVGIEQMGPNDPFTNLEIVDLALESLAAIGGNYVLVMSHLGFVSGLLDTLKLGHPMKAGILQALHAKSVHKVKTLLNTQRLDETSQNKVLSLAGLSGNIKDVMPRLDGLICGQRMKKAYDELSALCVMLEECGVAGRVNIDFSVVNDLDYYNGLIFHGYVEGVPNVVLTGGRYDNLMKKMGKNSGAIGFAVSLSELNTYYKSVRTYDFDILISYTPDCNFSALLSYSKAFTEQGKSVRLEREGAKHSWKCASCHRFTANGAEKVEECKKC